MTWLALREELAVEMSDLQPTMFDAWAMHRPTRDEKARQDDAREETSRRIATLHALGQTREARKLESYQRAHARRRKAQRAGRK